MELYKTETESFSITFI